VSRRTVRVQVEPLAVWPYPETTQRVAPPFTARYEQTLDILRMELDHLDATAAALRIVTKNGSDDLRRDGLLRAHAATIHPGVALAFTSKFGPMEIYCDTYLSRGSRPSWEANLRALALTLEKLRAIDRYGVGGGQGQQYVGWRVIESSPATVDRDWARLAAIADAPAGSMTADAMWRRARRAAHPDNHAGRRELWDELEQLGNRLKLS